jgi:hypothetical protein
MAGHAAQQKSLSAGSVLSLGSAGISGTSKNDDDQITWWRSKKDTNPIDALIDMVRIHAQMILLVIPHFTALVRRVTPALVVQKD